MRNVGCGVERETNIFVPLATTREILIAQSVNGTVNLANQKAREQSRRGHSSLSRLGINAQLPAKQTGVAYNSIRTFKFERNVARAQLRSVHRFSDDVGGSGTKFVGGITVVAWRDAANEDTKIPLRVTGGNEWKTLDDARIPPNPSASLAPSLSLLCILRREPRNFLSPR